MMYVIKRDGTREEVRFDEISKRIFSLSEGLNLNFIDPMVVAQKVVDGLSNEIKTYELDDLAAQICASMSTHHSDYSILAARLAISNLHKQTQPSFAELVKKFHGYIDPKTNKLSPFFSDEILELVSIHGDKIDAAIDHQKDFVQFDYFGIKTIEKIYLLSIDSKIVERPQHMFMRVALGIHGNDLDSAFETYNLMSEKYFTHATPTLINAGTPVAQMSSCFLLSMKDDSISGIYETLKDCALISKVAGGIGVNIHNIRARGSFISGSRGISDGIVPMLKNFHQTSLYVNQGGRRKGSFAIYLEPWHGDVESFIDLRKNHGSEELRARDLFLALWVCDEFMRRVESDEKWTLMCPNECPGLSDIYGVEFDTLYRKYEAEGRGIKTIKARDLWFKIVDAQIETGAPYMLYKDSCNKKSNQRNIGTIKGSNLCCEIMEYTSAEEIAVCNLASICLNKFIKDGEYDFKALHEMTKVVTRNLNKVIDRNYYIVPEAKYSNLKHRPIAIGVQGLADVFALLKLDFDSSEARELNRHMFETMYHGAVEASIELAKQDGAYETFEGSPASEGKFQFDLWGASPDSGLWDWEATRKDMIEYGLRNSLLISLMPTASTAQIFGNQEAFEPFTSNLYVRRVLSGEFVVINKYLLHDLNELGIWNDEVRRRLIAEKGSVQNIEEIPEDIRRRYRTVWEIPQRAILDMAADRAPFICQGMSMNIHMRGATSNKLSALHFYAWRRGLKTGMYYLRNTPAVEAVAFTVDNTREKNKDPEVLSETKEKPFDTLKQEEIYAAVSPQQDDDDENTCLSCGS